MSVVRVALGFVSMVCVALNQTSNRASMAFWVASSECESRSRPRCVCATRAWATAMPTGTSSPSSASSSQRRRDGFVRSGSTAAESQRGTGHVGDPFGVTEGGMPRLASIARVSRQCSVEVRGCGRQSDSTASQSRLTRLAPPRPALGCSAEAWPLAEGRQHAKQMLGFISSQSW